MRQNPTIKISGSALQKGELSTSPIGSQIKTALEIANDHAEIRSERRLNNPSKQVRDGMTRGTLL